MKKNFATLVAICLLVGALSITAFAANPAEGTVMRVSGVEQTSQNAFTTTFLQDFSNFQDGWNYAMEIAGDEDEMEDNKFDRILVEIYADWSANKDGEFTEEIWNGAGFDNDTIYIPDDAKVTLNLNGHTIDRHLKATEGDGEVICIDDDADVIIENGTITGGKGGDGAGGIHVEDDVTLTLNNVHIVGNISDYDGGAIVLGEGSTLTMTGGSFKNNGAARRGAAIFVDNATATFEGVEFKDNYSRGVVQGAAFYALDSDVVVKNCTFDGNGVLKDDLYSHDVIECWGGTLAITGSTFTNNGYKLYNEIFNAKESAVILLDDTPLVVNDCEFSGNLTYFIIRDHDDSSIQVTNTKFTNNSSGVFCGEGGTSDDSYFEQCTFSNNPAYGEFKTFYKISSRLTFKNCSWGDSTYTKSDFNNFAFISTTAPNGAGSIFGEGSLSMIVAILALIVSAASVCLTVVYNKKKTAPAAAYNSESSDE